MSRSKYAAARRSEAVDDASASYLVFAVDRLGPVETDAAAGIRADIEPSARVRALVRARLAERLGVRIDQIQIDKRGRIPELLIDGRPARLGSTGAAFLAVAAVLTLLGGLVVAAGYRSAAKRIR